MHIYAFGSVCRGEVDRGSDIDLLACINTPNSELDVTKYSVYKYESLRDLWESGNPFSWHLHLESKLLFSADGKDFLKGMGAPAPYSAADADCEKFRQLFDRSYQEANFNSNSSTFNLSCMFLAIRNFATCHSLSVGVPIFSRKSPLMVEPALSIDPEAFSVLTRARLLSTRGYGDLITPDQIAKTIRAAAAVPQWMTALRGRAL